MNIRTARKIAEDVGNVNFSNSDRRAAFHRLDISALNGSKEDFKLAKNIWDFFGNLGVKGKDTK
jgi:hypothetical protein